MLTSVASTVAAISAAPVALPSAASPAFAAPSPGAASPIRSCVPAIVLIGLPGDSPLSPRVAPGEAPGHWQGPLTHDRGFGRQRSSGGVGWPGPEALVPREE